MTLIELLIALIIEKYSRTVDHYRRFDWFYSYVKWMRSRLSGHPSWDGPLGVIAVIGPLLILVLLGLYLLGKILGLFAFLFAIAVLVFSLGPKNLHEEIRSFLDARRRGDKEGAILHLNDILGTHIPDNDAQLIRTITESTLVQTCDRLLAVIFWFVILGPLGAALFRSSSLLLQQMKNEPEPDSGFANTVYQLYFILLWIPARIAGLSYGISGSFVHALDNWRTFYPQAVENERDSNEELLVKTGLGAMQLDETFPEPTDEGNLEEVESALSLAWRAMIVWVTVLAVMTLAGWAG
jgi:membrane protein required for beta-lactamase induction